MVVLKDKNHGEFLITHLQGLVNCKSENGDIELCCKNGQMTKIHSVILAAASPLFVGKILIHSTDVFISLPDFRYINILN